MVPLLCLFSFDTNFDKFPNYKPVGIKNRNEYLRVLADRLEDMADIFINSILYLLRYFFEFPFFYS